MDFVTFEQWCDKQLMMAVEQGKEIEISCTSCKGHGLVTCRHCEHQHDCDDCGGEGMHSKDACEISPIEATKVFKVNAYFNEMIETFKLLAFVKNKPLIDVIGPFIVYYREVFQKWGGTW